MSTTSLTLESLPHSAGLSPAELRNLANAVDEGKASYARWMVKVIVGSSVAGGIAEDIRPAGTTSAIEKV